MIQNRPEPRTFSVPPKVTKVEATRIRPETFPIFLETRGTVRPRTSTTLLPEVNGEIVRVSPKFRDGGFFEEGDVLLEIDPLDYRVALAQAKSAEAQAYRELKEEEVRAQQAIDNWRRLGKSGEPSEMVRREPQLAEARARHAAAREEVLRAERDLEETRIRAPYEGRILEQLVDVGQVVAANTELARIFGTDVLEVRLPLTNQQLGFVDLPETFAGEGADSTTAPLPEVAFRGRIGSRDATWRGQVVRVDGAIDEASRQLFVVAEVEDPYRRHSDDPAPPLTIGMFVDAMIQGRELEDVFVLPRGAVRVGGEVIVIDEENRIERRPVFPVWAEEDRVVIPAEGGGLSPGEVICLTPLAYPANGALVLPTIDGVTPDVELPGRGPGIAGKAGRKGGKKGGDRPADEATGRPGPGKAKASS